MLVKTLCLPKIRAPGSNKTVASAASSTGFGRVALNSSSESPKGDEDLQKTKEKDKKDKGKNKDDEKKKKKDKNRKMKDKGDDKELTEKSKKKKAEDSADEVFDRIDEGDDEDDQDGGDDAAEEPTGTSKKPAARRPRQRKTAKDSGKMKEKSKTSSKGKKKTDGAENDSPFDHAMKAMSLKDVANMAETGSICAPKEDWVCYLVWLFAAFKSLSKRFQCQIICSR